MYKMKRQQDQTATVGAPAAPGGVNENEPDGDEAVGDIAETESGGDMTYIKEFVGGLSDTEFAYLQDCITARMNGEDKPDYKSDEEVTKERDDINSRRAATRNDGDGDELA